MRLNAVTLTIAAGLAALCLSSCSSNDQPSAVWYAPTVGSSDSDKGKASGTSDADDVGPQYTQPSMENLNGVPQKFPAKYPVKRYPHSQVILARVSPNLKPGRLNQVMIRTSDPKSKIAMFYEFDLAKSGWQLVDSYENPIYTAATWVKGDQQIEVRISPDVYHRQNVQLFSGPKPLPRKILGQAEQPSPLGHPLEPAKPQPPRVREEYTQPQPPERPEPPEDANN